MLTHRCFTSTCCSAAAKRKRWQCRLGSHRRRCCFHCRRCCWCCARRRCQETACHTGNSTYTHAPAGVDDDGAALAALLPNAKVGVVEDGAAWLAVASLSVGAADTDAAGASLLASASVHGCMHMQQLVLYGPLLGSGFLVGDDFLDAAASASAAPIKLDGAAGAGNAVVATVPAEHSERCISRNSTAYQLSPVERSARARVLERAAAL